MVGPRLRASRRRGSVLITRLSVGRFPWQSVMGVPAWRTFDGFLCVTFGFPFSIGVVILLTHLVGRGITCPRCGTRNRADAPACETCDLPLPPHASRL